MVKNTPPSKKRNATANATTTTNDNDKNKTTGLSSGREYKELLIARQGSPWKRNRTKDASNKRKPERCTHAYTFAECEPSCSQGVKEGNL